MVNWWGRGELEFLRCQAVFCRGVTLKGTGYPAYSATGTISRFPSLLFNFDKNISWQCDGLNNKQKKTA